MIHNMDLLGQHCFLKFAGRSSGLQSIIHVRYQSDEALILIENGSVLDGTLPSKQLKMVQAWVEIHKEELVVDWELAVNGDEPFRIAPLQ
jgi:hypothetical protein